MITTFLTSEFHKIRGCSRQMNNSILFSVNTLACGGKNFMVEVLISLQIQSEVIRDSIW